jgi:hypothetical protein
MVTGFLLGLHKLMHEEEGGKTYLLPVFVPARSELNSNLELLDKARNIVGDLLSAGDFKPFQHAKDMTQVEAPSSRIVQWIC